MTESETISWIFLATAMASQEEHTDFAGISMIADGVNHAVPTNKELQTSIKWLISKGLVLKKGSKYSLSETGSIIAREISVNSISVMEQWKNLERELIKLI